MRINQTDIADQFAEGFRMWACRLIVTALDEYWLNQAVEQVTGYGTSVIGCDAEAGVETWLDACQTPDGRPGAAVSFFAFNAKALAKAMPNRVGQCLMTAPTASVYDGLPDMMQGDDSARIDLGAKLRYFGDGFQKSKVIDGRRFWRIPVMDGECLIEESIGAVKAIGGGNLLLCGPTQRITLDAARDAVNTIAAIPQVITPFPGGVVRSGSKVGSRYKALFASTNDAYCPTLRSAVPTQLAEQTQCVYEIVINGYTQAAIENAMRQAVLTACHHPLVAISAGNYGGNLGKFHFHLRPIMQGTAT